MLARGLHDYSLEAGFLRRSFGEKSNDYGALMVSATDRYGLSDGVTAEAHVAATRDVQTAGLGAAVALGGIGMAEVRIAGSSTAVGTGEQVGMTFERRSRTSSVGVTAEFSSKNFMSVGLGDERKPPAAVIQAFAGMPVSFGSLGVSYILRDARTEPDAEYAAANASVRLGRLGNLVLAVRKSFVGDRDFGGEASLILPLGDRTSASAGAVLAQGGTSVSAAVQRSLPAGEGFGYRLGVSQGAVDRVDGKLSFQTRFAAYDAEVTWVDGKSGARLSTAGAIGMVGGDVFASRRLDESFAVVRVGKYPNVRVYADNQLVGRTGKNGEIIVPRLRPFDRNGLSIDLADLPLDAEIASGEQTVRPANRNGVVVLFAARPALAAIVPFVLDDGSALPAGSTVSLTGRAGEWISAPGGDVYLTGLAADNAGTAIWSLGRCEFRFSFTATGEAQPRLATAVCRRPVQ
jgi:outer membrane usher protein